MNTLTVGLLRSSSLDYYLDRTSLGRMPGRSGLACALGEGTGTWIGDGTRRVGLRGALQEDLLTAALSGRHPLSGRALRHKTTIVHGYDLCFSAPKSVSVLFGIGSAEHAELIVQAHHDAVKDALGYVERHALAARRSDGGERVVVATHGAIGAAFAHSSSRAGDPHLHTHVVVANLVQGADGRWTSADGRALFAHRLAAGAAYEAQLRVRLSEALGVTWQRSHSRQLDLSGFDPLTRSVFSRRHAEIAEHLAARSLTSPRAARIAWAVTRDPKGTAVPLEQRRRSWIELAHGFGLPPAVPSLDKALPGRARAELDERAFASTIMSLREGVTRRDVVRAWSLAAVPGARVREIDASVDAWVPDPGGPGVAELQLLPSTVLAPGYVVRALGPRPLRGTEQPIYQRAATAIGEYRHRWQVVDRHCALGPSDQATLRAMSSGQLADRLATQHAIDDARLRLGRYRSGIGHELDLRR